jgi:alanyl-tRNA synthetase
VGRFRITSEGSVAAGVRRIEAVAGESATRLDRADRDQLDALGEILRRDGGSFAEQAAALQAEIARLRKELQRTQQASAQAGLEDSLASPVAIGPVQLVSAEVPVENRDALLALGDHVRDKLGKAGVVVLGADLDGKGALLVTVTGDLVDAGTVHAGNLVKELAASVGGRGGGRPNTAQAGLPDADAVRQVLSAAPEVLARLLD